MDHDEVFTSIGRGRVLLRRARNGDGQNIATLIASVFSEYPGCLFDPAEFPELAAIATHFDRKGGAIWIAETPAHDLVGCCAVAPTARKDRYELSKVYVDRNWRGSGLAQCFVDRAETYAVGQGGVVLELFSDTRFAAAHRFYRKLRFEPCPGERYLADISYSWEFHFVKMLAPASDLPSLVN